MVEIKRAKECHLNISQKISEIFVDAFYEYFQYFSKDRKVLEKAFDHVFIIDRFFVGIIDGEIAGIAACTDNINNQCVKCKGQIFFRCFGIVKGIIATIVFKKMFQKTRNDLEKGTAGIDFIATHSKYRGKGIAASIIKYICTLNEYKRFVIRDVADNNVNAISVYEKAGFKEYKRIRKNYKKVGINAYVSFEYKNGD